MTSLPRVKSNFSSEILHLISIEILIIFRTYILSAHNTIRASIALVHNYSA